MKLGLRRYIMLFMHNNRYLFLIAYSPYLQRNIIIFFIFHEIFQAKKCQEILQHYTHDDKHFTSALTCLKPTMLLDEVS